MWRLYFVFRYINVRKQWTKVSNANRLYPVIEYDVTWGFMLELFLANFSIGDTILWSL